jgi:hypothetical protein
MKESREKERKVCTRCGTHKIMRSPADNTCAVCGDSLAALPAIKKDHGCLMRRIGYGRLTAAQ